MDIGSDRSEDLDICEVINQTNGAVVSRLILEAC